MVSLALCCAQRGSEPGSIDIIDLLPIARIVQSKAVSLVIPSTPLDPMRENMNVREPSACALIGNLLQRRFRQDREMLVDPLIPPCIVCLRVGLPSCIESR